MTRLELFFHRIFFTAEFTENAERKKVSTNTVFFSVESQIASSE
jgi:hypothetical protein